MIKILEKMVNFRLNLGKYSALLSILCILLISGCKSESTQKTPNQLFDECASGVVLIYCEHYYAISLPTGQTLYVTGLDDEEGGEYSSFLESEIKEHCKRHFGTGFFIDSKGNIMTNRHVADMSIDEKVAREKIYYSLIQERKSYVDSMEMAREVYAELEQKRSECYKYDAWGNLYADNNQIQEITNALAIVEKKFNEWSQLCDYITVNLNPSGIRFKTYYRIGIAYNNTNVVDTEDFFGSNECTVHKVSKRENADLAIIQLKSKQTPESAYIFDVSGNIKREKENKDIVDKLLQLFTGKVPMEVVKKDELKMDQQLYMIGYNHGIGLAQTRQGIKAQMTGGKLTQLPDGERLLYSIPTMQGSSGSPVIDEYGNLRGVNFAKATLNDDFNFGIPMNLIQDFFKE
ncbi:MAG: trypsin-like peptidase domain-containing protein [Prevotella sp.]|nr:trypsin-like peptidase domain-containing protein [Prevotella sp.]